jgi:transcriptional regulator CtsR
MGSIDTGYNTAQILEVLINTLVQKNVITEQEANYIKQTGKGATFRQAQAGAEQTGQG